MTSRFPKALAVVVLVLATALSGCGPSPGSAESTSTPGATAAAGLDPRYEEGAFGAWSASLHTDAGDARALSEKDASSDGGVQAWVDEDGGTAVFALSYGSYVSTLTAVDMRDGSTRWAVDLKDHRRASESVEAPLILGDFGFGDEYCLPMTVQNHVVCDNVGLIDMRDGAVAEIPEVTDFIGVGSGGAQDVVVGNIGGNVVPVGVAAWSVAGAELWRRDDLILDLSSVGSTWAVARRSGSRTSYEVVSLTDGATLSSFELPDGGFGANLAMATTEGVLTFGFLFNNGPQAQYKVELLDAGGGSLRVLAPAAQIENRQLSISAWPEEVLEHIPTPETALAGIEGPGRIRSRDDDWYRGDSNTETVTRVGAPDVPLPGIDEFGPVGDAVLTFDTDSLNAYAAADARPLWELDLGAPDAIDSHRRVKRAGRFGFLIGRQTDGGATTATLLAPGRPGSAGAGGSGDLTWEASTASGAPGISRSASDSGAAPGSPSAPSTAPAPAPSASMPPHHRIAAVGGRGGQRTAGLLRRSGRRQLRRDPPGLLDGRGLDHGPAVLLGVIARGHPRRHRGAGRDDPRRGALEGDGGHRRRLLRGAELALRVPLLPAGRDGRGADGRRRPPAPDEDRRDRRGEPGAQRRRRALRPLLPGLAHLHDARHDGVAAHDAGGGDHRDPLLLGRLLPPLHGDEHQQSLLPDPGAEHDERLRVHGRLGRARAAAARVGRTVPSSAGP